MFSTTYRNHRKRFGLRMNLIAGIINRETRILVSQEVYFLILRISRAGFSRIFGLRLTIILNALGKHAILFV